MAIKAKPTVYKGVQMRSRLEATWAAFFDEIGESWEYEPAIYDTPGWSPDFLLGTLGLVEVKPVEDVDEWREHECLGYIDKRLSEYQYRPVLLLGAKPYTIALASGDDKYSHRSVIEMVVVGIAVDADPKLEICSTVAGMMGASWDVWEFPKVVLGLSRDRRPYLEIVYSVYDMGSGLAQDALRAVEIVDQYWARAKNHTQWRSPRGG